MSYKLVKCSLTDPSHAVGITTAGEIKRVYPNMTYQDLGVHGEYKDLDDELCLVSWYLPSNVGFSLTHVIAAENVFKGFVKRRKSIIGCDTSRQDDPVYYLFIVEVKYSKTQDNDLSIIIASFITQVMI